MKVLKLTEKSLFEQGFSSSTKKTTIRTPQPSTPTTSKPPTPTPSNDKKLKEKLHKKDLEIQKLQNDYRKLEKEVKSLLLEKDSLIRNINDQEKALVEARKNKVVEFKVPTTIRIRKLLNDYKDYTTKTLYKRLVSPGKDMWIIKEYNDFVREMQEEGKI